MEYDAPERDKIVLTLNRKELDDLRVALEAAEGHQGMTQATSTTFLAITLHDAAVEHYERWED